MELQQKLQKLNSLHKQYHNLFPLEMWDDATKEEVKNSFTYHSSKIEGLTLSYAETIKFLKEGIIKEGARVKDLSDVKNHREVLDFVFENYQKLEFTEETIKNLHKVLMKDPFQWDVVDPITGGAGEYKMEPNATFRPGNIVHEYMSPDRTAGAMKGLVEKLNYWLQNRSADSIDHHPVTISAFFHYEFLNVIHPFWDGNGRMARLLTSLILMKNGYPPLSIHISEKHSYIDALIKSETDQERKPIVTFFFDKMIKTLAEKLSNRK